MPYKIPTLPGQFHIGGLFKIFQAKHGECTDEIDTMSVRTFEAVKWTLKMLNEANYIPGITLGVEAYPTCNVEGKAVEQTTNLVKSRQLPIIGLVGPEYSFEAVDTSSYISSLGKNRLILQTLFSTTASALSDKTKYQNILRVIPDDTKQTSVIMSLIKKMEWNYIGFVYENNTYGRGNYEALQIRAKKNSICIASAQAVSVETGVVDIKNLKIQLESMIYHPESQISGIIMFGSTGTAKAFLSSAQSLSDTIRFRLSIIFSEGTADIDTETLNNYAISKGSFFTSPHVLKFEKFQHHWKNILTNKTVLNQEVLTNPWLENVIKKFVPCDVLNVSCSMPAWSSVKSVTGENVFEGYAIVSTLLIAKILKNLQVKICGGNGICDELNITLQQRKYELLEEGENCQLNMNDFNESAFALETQLLRDYFENTHGTKWPNITKAQCNIGRKCDSCRNLNLANEIMFRRGNLYVVAVVPIHNRNSSDRLKCGVIRTANGWELAEGIKFAVESANKKTGSFSNLFHGKQIGFIIFNSCDQPLLIQRKLLQFFSEDYVFKDGTKFSEVRKNILGFVAAYGSSTSRLSSLILQDFNFPQISYASTAAILSDRSTYKYFLRTCTPDDKQAVAMLNIVKTLNSSYIQILYSEGIYGEGARDAIMHSAKDFKICIANQIEVKENQYSKINDDLNRTPYATVVLLFLKSHVLKDVVAKLHDTLSLGTFLFIGSEAFGTRLDIISGKNNLEGTISLSLQMKPAIGTSRFEKYLYDTLANKSEDLNPWTNEYFEQRNTCFLPGSFNKLSASQCANFKEEFNDKDYQPELWTAFAINAMFSLLQGTNKSFGELCGSQSSTLCQRYRDSPQKVYDMIKNEKLVIDDSGIPSKVFNENGDGNIGYKIYQVQRKTTDASQLTFIEIGRYTLNKDGYSVYEKIIKDPFKVLPSKCPNPKECSKCLMQYTGSSSINNLSSEAQSSKATVALGVLFGLTLLALGIMIVLFCKMYGRKINVDDNPYLEPHLSTNLDHLYYYGDSGCTSCSSGTDIPNLPNPSEHQQEIVTTMKEQTN
ncbi:uncharacterized protein LOC133203393 [Saccostrea echinata]|uniref:uncharacterized protein LOC133203393 n=1 Tax=Saccostrea echinata TaxID=191078 RepID=UPI002A81995C|nr:uncharacterized protein LOC133203393 [Saccostrea echinata]